MAPEPALLLLPGAIGIQGQVALAEFATTGMPETAATPINMNTGQPGKKIDLGNDISWIIAAVGDGFAVNPKDHETYSNIAFWPQTPRWNRSSYRPPISDTRLSLAQP